MFRGGAGIAQIKVPNIKLESIDGGQCSDILHLDGEDLYFDLASFDSKTHDIETIFIYGRGDKSLSLTADDVVNLLNTSNTLKLLTNAGDLLASLVEDGWENRSFHIYTHEDALLIVGADLAIDFM